MIVLGTGNSKKRLEIEELLRCVKTSFSTLADFPQQLEVVENGASFAENARKKASEQARFLNHWVLAEDSGLCVDILDGAPGIYSARFAEMHGIRENANDADNNLLLLKKLGDLPLEKRTAHFTCATALADPSGAIRAETEGFCRGRIRFEPSGNGGFGYDPLFEIVEYHKTFGELDPAVKRAISHRSRAMRLLIPSLIALHI